MTFKWLPDAALDPHPRLTWFVECCFDLAVLALYRKEEILPRDYRLAPGTLIVSNHQSDADVPILTTVLCRREGLHIRWPLPFYAMREDLMRRGALADLLADWPWPLRAPFGALSLAWFLRIVRAEPMRRLREFTLGETLDALRAAGFAAANPDTLFNARGRRELTAALGGLPPRLDRINARRLGKLRLSRWGLRRLQLASFRVLKPQFRTEIAAQLARFAALLDAGRMVYFAPEGTISKTGRFGRIRVGSRRVYRLAASPPPVLPLALSYDSLGPGRMRVVVRVGESLPGLDSSDERRFTAGLRGHIRRLYAVTPSHLIARFLVAGPVSFTTEAFARWLRSATAAIAAAGLMLDPLLEREASEALATRRLVWLERKGLVAQAADGWHNRWPSASAPGWRKPANMVRYLDNALADHLAALAPELARELMS